MPIPGIGGRTPKGSNPLYDRLNPPKTTRLCDAVECKDPPLPNYRWCKKHSELRTEVGSYSHQELTEEVLKAEEEQDKKDEKTRVERENNMRPWKKKQGQEGARNGGGNGSGSGEGAAAGGA